MRRFFPCIFAFLTAAALLLAGCLRQPVTPPETTATTLSTATTAPTQTTASTTASTTAPVTIPTETTHPTTIPTQPRIGWVEENEKRYYYDESGVMLTGWLDQEYDRYYLQSDGSMAIGKIEIDGNTCYFGPDGVQILLVNPWNYLPENYTAETVDINGWQYVDIRCYDALIQMLDDCRTAGLSPHVASAYRTHGDQIYLYNNKIQRLINQGYSEAEARVLAGTVVAVPGTSEHELGLALDLVDNSYRNLDEAQENTAVQKWLMENSWKYGFILRYPSNKSDITGIIYEPWHYRYVGKIAAKEIYDSGLCLEEYLEALP